MGSFDLVITLSGPGTVSGPFYVLPAGKGGDSWHLRVASSNCSSILTWTALARLASRTSRDMHTKQHCRRRRLRVLPLSEDGHVCELERSTSATHSRISTLMAIAVMKLIKLFRRTFKHDVGESLRSMLARKLLLTLARTALAEAQARRDYIEQEKDLVLVERRRAENLQWSLDRVEAQLARLRKDAEGTVKEYLSACGHLTTERAVTAGEALRAEGEKEALLRKLGAKERLIEHLYRALSTSFCLAPCNELTRLCTECISEPEADDGSSASTSSSPPTSISGE